MKINMKSFEVVSDQIRNWEKERKRFTHNMGYLYDQFDNEKQFIEVEKYTKDLGAFIYSNQEKRFIFIKEEAHEIVKEFIKKIK